MDAPSAAGGRAPLASLDPAAGGLIIPSPRTHWRLCAAPEGFLAMAGNVQNFNDGNFADEVLSSDQPVLVDFTAVWCGPCKKIYPVIEGLANDYAGRIKVGKLDIDDNPQTPVKYHVRAVPTLIMFVDGKPVDQIMGAQPRKRIQAMFDKATG
jgi:thioredoxin 1